MLPPGGGSGQLVDSCSAGAPLPSPPLSRAMCAPPGGCFQRVPVGGSTEADSLIRLIRCVVNFQFGGSLRVIN